MSNENVVIDVSKETAEFVGRKVDEIEELQKVHLKSCTDPYMIGLYNGMELAKSMLTGVNPVYFAEVAIKEVAEDGNSEEEVCVDQRGELPEVVQG